MPRDDFFEEFKSKIDRTKIDKVKVAVVSGASEALKRKAKNFKKTDDEVLKEIVDDLDKIIKNIDS
jgi:methionine synthase II (cobalamin-independent)